jgi:hypothetical protein
VRVEARAPQALLQTHVELHEVREQIGNVFGRNADARVGDRELHAIAREKFGRDPHFAFGVNLSALEMKLRRICDSFLSSVNSLMSPCGSSNSNEMEVLATMGLNMPRNADNRSTSSNHSGRDGDAPGFDLGEVEQIAHHVGELARRRCG